MVKARTDKAEISKEYGLLDAESGTEAGVWACHAKLIASPECFSVCRVDWEPSLNLLEVVVTSSDQPVVLDITVLVDVSYH